MFLRPVGLRFPIFVASQRNEIVELEAVFGSSGNIDSKLADKSGSVTGFLQHRRITSRRVFGRNCRHSERVLVCSLVETGEEGRSTGGTNRRRHKRVFEANSFFRESV